MRRPRVCLILVPSQAALYDPRFARHTPLPLVLGVLQGHLRHEGFDAVSVDLNLAMSRDDQAPLSDAWALLFDRERVLRCLATGTDSGLDGLLDGMLAGTPAAECDVVGISTGPEMAFSEIHLALLLGRRIQATLGKPVVFGGLNLGFLWNFRESFDDLWRAIPGGTYLFIGPGERSFARLLAGGTPDERVHPSLPGAIYRREAGFVRNPYDAPTFVTPDFGGLPLARYTRCCDVSAPAAESEHRNLVHNYKWPVWAATRASDRNRELPDGCREERLVIPYVFNYNCPHRCAFCVQSRADKPPAANAGAGKVIADLEALSRQYETSYFCFYDNAFNYSPAFVADFCRLARERELSIHWSDCARFDNLDERTLDDLYLAGCRKLVFGLDTASEKVLRLIHKGLDLQQARRVLEWCRDRAIWAEIEVIVGLPFETEEEFVATRDFVADQVARGTITDFHVNRYFVLPESLLGSHPERYGIAIERMANAYDASLAREFAAFSAMSAPAGSARSPDRGRRPTPWRYREIGGRPAGQIEDEADDKFSRMMALKTRLRSSP